MLVERRLWGRNPGLLDGTCQSHCFFVLTEDHRRYPGILRMNTVDWRRAKCLRIFIIVLVGGDLLVPGQKAWAAWATLSSKITTRDIKPSFRSNSVGSHWTCLFLHPFRRTRNLVDLWAIEHMGTARRAHTALLIKSRLRVRLPSPSPLAGHPFRQV